jgi:hypothetical protein
MNKSVFLPIGLLALAIAQSSSAATISITNPGFESQFLNNGIVQIVTPTGWSIYNPQNIDQNADSVGIINPAGTAHYPGGAAEGRNASVIFMGGSATGEAGFFQALGDTLQAGMRYTLEVEVGNIASGTANFGFFDLDGFPGYRIDLLAGSTVIASDNNTLSIPEGEFRTSTIQVDIEESHPALGSLLGLRLVNLNISGTAEEPGIEVNFDDARLTALIVPEPGVAALLVPGFIALAFAARRRSVQGSPGRLTRGQRLPEPAARMGTLR